MGFNSQSPMLDKVLFSLGVQQKNGIRENYIVLGFECDKPSHKINPKVRSYVKKTQKNLNVHAFFQSSSGRRCRSTTADHHAGNHFWRRWLPEMKNGDTSLFVSTSQTRIHSPTSPIFVLNPLIRVNPQEPLKV